MARFEVSQASMHRWSLHPGGRNISGIFLEVYMEQTAKRSCAPCCSTTRECKRYRTGPVEERRDMQWRTFNEEGFLVALLNICMPRRTSKKGDKLTFMVDAFRTSIGDISGTLVASFKGELCIGTWGAVTLQVVDVKGLEVSDAEVILETRPTCSRPFSLDKARPAGSHTESTILKLALDARNSCDQGEGVYRRVRRALARQARSAERARRQQNGADGLAVRKAAVTPPRRTSFTLTFSGTSGSTTGDRSSVASSVSHLGSVGSRQSRQSGGSTPKMFTRRSTDRGATESGYLEASWRNLLRLAPSRRPQEVVANAFQQWVPQDWTSMWQGAWPLQLSGAAEKIEVVPLMEAEFRRDCIVLYNTLFPRTRGPGFGALRQFALGFEAAPSKLQFPPVNAKVAAALSFDRRNSEAESIYLDSLNKAQRQSFSQKVLRKLSVPRLSQGSKRSSAASSRADMRGSRRASTSTERVSTSTDSIGGGQGCEDEAAISSQATPEGGTSINLALSSTPTSSHGWFFSPRKNIRTTAERVRWTSEEPGTDAGGSGNLLGATMSTQTYATQDPVPILVVQNSIGDGPSNSLHGGSRILSQPITFIDDYSPRIMLLKRLLISFGFCGVCYSEAENSSQPGDMWPYPLASLLGHGSRILIRLEDVEPSEFLNFLLTGDPQSSDWKESGIPRPLQRRMAATHAVEITEMGQLVERKLRVTNAAESVQNISDGIRKKHLGLNLPIGGVGNPSPLGRDHIIGFHGEVILRGPESPPTPSSSTGLWGRTSHICSSQGSSRTSCESSGSARLSGTGDIWRVVSNVQCGHLYIRTDDFGEVAVPSESVRGRTSRREEMRRKLKERPMRDILPLEQARMKLEVDSQTSAAGELLFPSTVARLRTPRRDDACTVVGDRAGQMHLIRVRSMPNLKWNATHISSDDVRWAHEAMLLRFAPQCYLPPPPTVNALRLLLEDYDPINVQLFGSGRFKSVEDLHDELSERTSFIRWSGGQLERHCEPVILQLSWKGYVLMKTHEHVEKKDCPVQKRSFIATRLLPHENWRQAIGRIVESELNLPMAPFFESMEPACQVDFGSHALVEETAMSPSFPGLRSSYSSHMVRWAIREDAVGLYRSHGLPVDESSPPGKPSLLGSSFTTLKLAGSRRRIFWKWVPIMEAQKLQRFVNLGEATADERWARYAYQQEGAVQFPPTETALAILLRRCGVDTTALVQGGNSLHDLWLELTHEESRLQMSAGQILRVVEVTVLKLQWRTSSSDDTRIMVQIGIAGRASSACRRLPCTHRRKDEGWMDSVSRLLLEDLAANLSPHQVRSLLTSKSGDRTECTFCEEQKQSEDYPGIECLRRTHLVTCTLREDASSCPLGRALGLRQEEATSNPSSEAHDTHEVSSRATWGEMLRRPLSVFPSESSHHTSPANRFDAQACFEWVEAAALPELPGSELFDSHLASQVQKKVASVLLGLEGTAPNMKSPFGVEHDASGKSAEISALGNRKWRSYRTQGALQIPSDVGGMRMTLTQSTFQDLVDMCDRLDLCHPSVDLAMDSTQIHPRWVIDQRHAERELFKQLLATNAREAHEVLAWIEAYRDKHRTPGQAHASMRKRTRRSHLGESIVWHV